MASDIVDCHKRHYDADVSYMLQRPDALEHLRPLYKTIHENWVKVDREQVEAIMIQIGAYMGWDADEAKRQLESYETQNAAPSKGMHHKYWFRVSAISWLTSGFALTPAIAIAGISFIAA